MFDLTKTWTSIIWSILVAIIAGLFVHLLTFDFYIPASALTFAIVSKVLDSQKNKTLNQNRINEIDKLNENHEANRLKILKRVAYDEIHIVRPMIKRENISGIISCFGSLEFIVTEISKCCDTDNNRNRFRIVKGLISDTKTIFDKSQKDPNIVKPFDSAITAINNLESYLNDL